MASSPTRQSIDCEHGRFARCTSVKIGYTTRELALDAAEEMMQADMVKRGCHITPYLCDDCHEWHVYNRLIVGHGWKRRARE